MEEIIKNGCFMHHFPPFFVKWPRRDLNPHTPYEIQDFKSCASAYSATRPVGITKYHAPAKNVQLQAMKLLRPRLALPETSGLDFVAFSKKVRKGVTNLTRSAPSSLLERPNRADWRG